MRQRPPRYTIFPNTTLFRAGFSGRVALRGKWCEGRFRIGLINVVNGQGAFQLTPIQIEVEGGQIRDIVRSVPSNDLILSDFHRVSHSDGLMRNVKLSDVGKNPMHPYTAGALEYFLDEFSGLSDDIPLPVDPESPLMIRGWIFFRNLSRAGHVYGGLVSESRDEIIFFAMDRVARADVGRVFRDAPLCVGFRGEFLPREGYARPLDGVYRFILVNVVGDVYGSRLTEIAVTFADGAVLTVERADVQPQDVERAERLLAAKIVS